MALIVDAVFDVALAYIRDNVTTLTICTADPTTFSIATTEGTSMCGTVACTDGEIDAPANGTSGRDINIQAITDGAVTCSGTVTASHWALVTGTILLASGSLSADQSVTDGNIFTLDAFTIQINDAT